MVLSQSPRGSTLGADALHKTYHRSSFAHCILSLRQQLQVIGFIRAPGLSNMAIVHATQPCPALSLTKDWQLYISITQYIGIGQKIFFFVDHIVLQSKEVSQADLPSCRRDTGCTYLSFLQWWPGMVLTVKSPKSFTVMAGLWTSIGYILKPSFSSASSSFPLASVTRTTTPLIQWIQNFFL